MKYILLIMVIVQFFSLPLYSQIVIIANKDMKLEVKSKFQVIDIFTIEVTSAEDGSAITLFDIKSGEAKDAFCSAIGKTNVSLKNMWMKAMFAGEGNAPEGVRSEDEMLTKVSSTPGAVGYVRKGKETDAVKVLFTIE